jgi:hypothetical protein
MQDHVYRPHLWPPRQLHTAVFHQPQGRREAKHIGKGKAEKRATLVAKEEIQAKLPLGDTPILDATRDRIDTFQAFAERWLKGHVAG